MEKRLIGHNHELEDLIIKKYIELRQKKGGCSTCKPYISDDINDGRPVSFYVVGEDFPKQTFRVMFVGKTVANGWESEDSIPDSDFLDAREYSRENQFLPVRNSWTKGYFFWEAIKGICQIIWDDNSLDEIWRKIAITNLVKCSTSVNEDETPDSLKRNCIEKMRFFENEVIIAKPTHLILFTGSHGPKYYDDYINKLDFGYNFPPVDVTRVTYYDKNVGVSWWHRKFLKENKTRLNLLRTYHPASRRTPSEQSSFCNSLAEWIMQNPTE